MALIKPNKNLSVVGKSDKQGSGSVNYYRVNIILPPLQSVKLRKDIIKWS